jgi:hypothetical protein
VVQRFFNWLYGPEAKRAWRYWSEMGVVLPFAVFVFFVLTWVGEVIVRYV